MRTPTVPKLKRVPAGAGGSVQSMQLLSQNGPMYLEP